MNFQVIGSLVGMHLNMVMHCLIYKGVGGLNIYRIVCITF